MRHFFWSNEMKKLSLFLAVAMSMGASIAAHASQFAVEVAYTGHTIATKYMTMVGMMLFDTDPLAPVMKALDTIEAQIKSQSDKADAEIKAIGKVTTDTQTALENLGIKQKELVDRMLMIEQKSTAPQDEDTKVEGWGQQLVKSDEYKNKLALITGNRQFGSIGMEIKNTLTGSDATVAPDRKPGIVAGAAPILTMESFLNSLPTSSNAIEFTKENVFTNNAAEAAEGAAKAESALTWTLVNMPVSTVAHYLRISRQLASDNVALAAYVENRLKYGVNRKVETQIVAGDGVAPNLSGILDAGNFTAHGYADAALGATLKKLVLIRKMIADVWVAGYPADAILLNPVDWATIEIDLLTSTSNAVRVGVNAAGQQTLWGVPVIQSIGMTADQVAVGAFGQAYTIYNREGVVVEMSDSDSDNFTKNLITIRAERRLALATEVPAAVRAGDLTPA
jgi:HK97 family phage major capsid protein